MGWVFNKDRDFKKNDLTGQARNLIPENKGLINAISTYLVSPS